jgi:hypothetical protein
VVGVVGVELATNGDSVGLLRGAGIGVGEATTARFGCMSPPSTSWCQGRAADTAFLRVGGTT